jgi:hypothetical protein
VKRLSSSGRVKKRRKNSGKKIDIKYNKKEHFIDILNNRV